LTRTLWGVGAVAQELWQRGGLTLACRGRDGGATTAGDATVGGSAGSGVTIGGSAAVPGRAVVPRPGEGRTLVTQPELPATSQPARNNDPR
jgi:hypothetical protein